VAGNNLVVNTCQYTRALHGWVSYTKRNKDLQTFNVFAAYQSVRTFAWFTSDILQQLYAQIAEMHGDLPTALLLDDVCGADSKLARSTQKQSTTSKQSTLGTYKKTRVGFFDIRNISRHLERKKEQYQAIGRGHLSTRPKKMVSVSFTKTSSSILSAFFQMSVFPFLV